MKRNAFTKLISIVVIVCIGTGLFLLCSTLLSLLLSEVIWVRKVVLKNPFMYILLFGYLPAILSGLLTGSLTAFSFWGFRLGDCAMWSSAACALLLFPAVINVGLQALLSLWSFLLLLKYPLFVLASLLSFTGVQRLSTNPATKRVTAGQG